MAEEGLAGGRQRGADGELRSSRRAFLRHASTLAFAALSPTLLATPVAAHGAPTRGPGPRVLTRDHGHEIAQAWIRRIFLRVRADGYAPTGSAPSGQQNADGFDHLQGFTPTSAARLYAYAGIAMYEAVVGGMHAHRSLAGQLTGMPTMPSAHPATRHDWPTALSAAVAGTASSLFTRQASRQDIDAFHIAQVRARREAGVPAATIAASLAHGEAVASALRPWIDADGYTDVRRRAAEHGYTPPTGPGLWQPTPPSFAPALEPYWSGIRPFVLRSAGEVTPDPPVPFSEERGSPFHGEALRTYQAGLVLTAEQRSVARFWADNPLQSGLPPGHWMLTVGQVAAQRSLQLDVTVEALARTGIALADALLSCWHCKYMLNVLRPVTYVQAHIDPSWLPLMSTPPFPEYTSGHSVSSVAAAVVLTDLLGSFPYADRHDLVGDLADAERTRHFASFLHAAEEAAQSRIYGGIHFPMGVEAGKDQGREVGRIVLARVRSRR
ncbi:MAG TPA: vanadium-dependent haloperoxidase [Egibacteraceae bacterium]|jgi:hypothetical protein|nr:vanadium-dependent haloperoxidase [Egibacteraceae bacterium]